MTWPDDEPREWRRGQIYVVVPAQQVVCSQATLNWLLHDLDRISWPGNEGDSARVVFERAAVGAGVAGGMGGGVVINGGWIHPELVPLGLGDEIRAVLRVTSTGSRWRVGRNGDPDRLNGTG